MVVIGPGPARLTATYEFLTTSDVKLIILEKSGEFEGSRGRQRALHRLGNTGPFQVGPRDQLVALNDAGRSEVHGRFDDLKKALLPSVFSLP